MGRYDDLMFDQLSSQVVGLALAWGIGFLVGLEREWAANKPVGLRSFTLIGGTGGLAALLGDMWGGWLVAVGLLALTSLIIVHSLRYRPATAPATADAEAQGAEPDQGTTTVLAALAVYLVGAACVAGYQAHGVVMGGIITLLLHWKKPLHGLVGRIGETEFSAVIRFVLITLVVLPVLPNRTFGPYDVFNPFQAWLLVVLIVGLNLTGYVAFRLLRADHGAVVGGILGGLISSTAATVSFARMTRRDGDLTASAALIILLASTVLYGRVGVELLVVAPALLSHAAAPMAAYAAVTLAASAALLPRVRRQRITMPEQENPARMKVALTFAALYVVIVFAVAATRDYLGDDAIYGVALVSGLTNVDAMTLSVAQLFNRGNVNAETAWRSIFLATLSNLLFKIGAASVLGTAGLRNYMLTLGTATLAAGVAVLLFWP